MKNRTINESSFSDIDIIAQESKDFREFVKEFYKEYNDFPKDKDTIKWLKSVYDNRSTDESVINESSVEIGDIVFFPSANSAATVIDRLGRSVTLKLANGKKVKTIINKIKLMAQDNVNEAISRDAAYIHGILKSGQDATQNFIDDNGLDGEKLSDYVKNNRNNIDGYNVKHYISGERGTVGSVPKLRQAFIKKFKKGNKPNPNSFFNEQKVDMAEAELKLGVRYVNKQGKEGFIQTGGSTNPKNWFWFDGKIKHPYDKVKKELKPAKDQKKTGFSDYLKQGGRVFDNINPSDSPPVNEKFDRTHLGILQYAFKDINKINPSEPAYKRLAQMLSKLSKQELQQIIDADIKFISILAKTLLTKNESHFKVGDTVKMLHGGIGVVKSLDKEDGADDEKYYNIELPNGDVMKHAPNELTAESVNEGNAFTGALFKARKEGLTEFEFNGKMYPVHKLEEEKEEVVTESKITKNSLKKIIKEEYYNVKNFMEENYGFTPELGKVYSSLINKSFLKEQEKKNEGDESDSDMAVDQLELSIRKAQNLITKLRGRGDLEPWVQSLITKAEDYISTISDYSEVDEYDVENYQDLKEFSKFMNEYTYDINEAEYQGRKVKLGKVMQGDTKKFKVYVKNDKGNVVKVNFGQGGDAKGGTMRIRKDNPKARASFRARHNCDNPGPRYKARYWSCRQW